MPEERLELLQQPKRCIKTQTGEKCIAFVFYADYNITDKSSTERIIKNAAVSPEEKILQEKF